MQTILEQNQSSDMMPDWPLPGDIDLNIHDLPHKSSTTEWWYLHAHLTSIKGRNLSLFVSFFRHAIKLNKKKGEYDYAHSVLWAISDLDEHKYYTVSLVDHRAPEIGLKQLRDPKSKKDPFIKKATIEMLKKGVVPFPDELLKNDPSIPWTHLHLNYDGQEFKKLKDHTYQLRLHHKRSGLKVDLNIKPLIKPVRHGKDGVIRNSAVEDMFYYFISNCASKGTIQIRKETLTIHEGTAWYDHEFGARTNSKKSITKQDVAWNWMAIQLNDGYQFSIFDVHTNKKVKDKDALFLSIDPNGKKSTTLDYKFDAYGTPWTSTRTFNEYPTRWRIKSVAYQLDIDIVAVFDAQEFGTVISKPAFWEGRLNVTGTHRGKPISGKAYLERHGHIKTDSLGNFLKAVSKTTLQSVKKILPLHPSSAKLKELVSHENNAHLIKDLDRSVYENKLIQPIRQITDRGGKSWRSYATLACCDVVGGNSQKDIDWLALPELLHVGSLMVDDVQDKSGIRRGGPAAHILHGEALAINSGTAAYFIGQACIYHSDRTEAIKVQIYHWYFEAMRASHSGQALDIYGLEYLMDEVIKNQSLALSLPKRVLGIHRLKSATPASYLAKIGALLGGGSSEQINALGDFFDALGIAFQVIDDTLNLKGFKDNLKTKAEDLSAGKITYPVALAMSLLKQKDRSALWNIIKSKTIEIEKLSEAILLLEKCNAIALSEAYAQKILEKAWRKLDPVIEDNMIKINLRAFSWFVLERTY